MVLMESLFWLPSFVLMISWFLASFFGPYGKFELLFLLLGGWRTQMT